MQDVKAYFSLPKTGTVETAAAPYWRYIQTHQPDIKMVVVRRPVEEAVESAMRTGIFDRDLITKVMIKADKKLDQIEQRVEGIMSVRYDDLQHEHTCQAIFEHCLPYPHDRAWYEAMVPLNLQINLQQMVDYYNAFEPQLTKLAKIAKYQMIADFGRKEPVDRDDGIVIKEEDFEAVYRDGRKLLEEHCALSGEPPDSVDTKNIPLLREIEKRGGMHVMTARCNGKMFGYVMSIVSQSVNSMDILGGAEVTFYASKEFPGLGMKLQRASIEAMRQKGITDLFFHTGNLADGPRSSTLYRRLGAVKSGEMYRLSLTG